MIINVNKISDKGYALNDTVDIDNAQLLEEGSFFLEEVDYQVQLKRQDRRIQAQGSIQTAVSLVCVRCLEQFELKIHSRFDIILLNTLAFCVTNAQIKLIRSVAFLGLRSI